MNLIIMRHGEAESLAARDRDRALTALGTEDATRAAAAFPQVPDLLLASPYRRARQTADRVAANFGDLEVQELAALVPEGRPSDVVNELLATTAAVVCLVSHQPLVGKLVMQLAGASQSMAPASAVLIDIQAPFADRTGKVSWQWHA